MKYLKSFLFTLSAVLLLQSAAFALSEEGDVPVEADVLKQFFQVLSADTKSEDVEALAKEYGLYASYHNNGNATYRYRVAASEAVADASVKAKGSFVGITFYILNHDAVTEISYFDMDAMTEAFWYPASGYFVEDYNSPRNAVTVTGADGVERRTCLLPVDTALEAVNYVPTDSPDGNLLAQLFLSAHEGMTEKEILTFVSDNHLVYSSSGPGNFKTIAYTEDVAEKNGKNGTVVTFDADDSGLIWMQYSYYPSAYRQGISAAFYSRAYAASQKLDEGFLLCRTGSNPRQYKDPIRLIRLLHGE